MCNEIRVSALLLVAALCGELGTGCVHASLGQGPLATTPDGRARWTRQVVSVRVRGYVLQGNAVAEAEWSGTGFWVGEGLVATNAHVVVRSWNIHLVDDDGGEHSVSAVVALDQEHDLAILRAEGGADSMSAPLASAAMDAPALRGRPILAAADQFGSLTINEGVITNVYKGPLGPEILNNANIGSGSSGGPVYDLATGKVLGVTYASYDDPHRSAAIPIEHLRRLVAETKGRRGVAPADLFRDPDGALELSAHKRFCLGPGDAFPVEFAVRGRTDVLVDVEPESENPNRYVMMMGVAGAPIPFGAGIFEGSTRQAMTLNGTVDNRPYVLSVGVPPELAYGLCVDVRVHRIAWSRRLAAVTAERM